MADPRDFMVSEDIHIKTGLEVQRYLAMPEDILRELDKVYGISGSGQGAELLKSVTDAVIPDVDGTLEKCRKNRRDRSGRFRAGSRKNRERDHLSALGQKASDIHIEPFEDPAGRASRKCWCGFRVDGFLKAGGVPNPLDLSERRDRQNKDHDQLHEHHRTAHPQSGRIQVMAKGNPIEFRVEIVPTVYGESVVMRILDRKAVQVDIQNLGFFPDTLDRYLGLMAGVGGKKNFGIVLVCGPTGSGNPPRSTRRLTTSTDRHQNITAENPVEYNLGRDRSEFKSIPDLKLGEDKCFDFATALRSFLRLDPDVIMVGEIRDQETAHIAMEAAMTGHLVFSTIHTNDAPSTVTRLVDMGIPAFMVASTLKCVLAQRLCRRLCPDCKTPRAPTVEEAEVFKTNQITLPSRRADFSGGGVPDMQRQWV
jgi:type IV pilus assembly protein PilB